MSRFNRLSNSLFVGSLISIALVNFSFKATSGHGQYYSDDQILKVILMTDTLRGLGKNDRALALAEEAEKSAKKSKNIELQAMALNRQGKALMATNKRADQKFEKSNELLNKSGSTNSKLSQFEKGSKSTGGY